VCLAAKCVVVFSYKMWCGVRLQNVLECLAAKCVVVFSWKMCWGVWL